MSFREAALTVMRVVLLHASVASLHAQNETTATLTGEVLTLEATAVADADVTLIHGPTAARWSTRTNPRGLFLLENLPCGGPYSLTITHSSLGSYREQELILDLGESPHRILRLTPAAAARKAIALDPLKVSQRPHHTPQELFHVVDFA